MASLQSSPVLGGASWGRVASLLPGLALCATVTGSAMLAENVSHRILEGRSLEALVFAIVFGVALRSVWVPGQPLQRGIGFSAKYLLEGAVVLLGASVSLGAVVAAGPLLLLGIMGLVATSILVSYGIGRALGLAPRMALLIACGNAICGNSAIAAVAPVIRAEGRDVTASIAFTAVFGVMAVLALPVLGLALGMSATAFGTFAGLVTYAVPQVVAAAAPLGLVAVQTGTLVKLVRVMMLGPVCIVLSLFFRAEGGQPLINGAKTGWGKTVFRLVPWFIIGFFALAALRSAGLVPLVLLPLLHHLAMLMTVMSMAALGLGVEVASVAKAGRRVIGAVTLSLLALGLMSFGLVGLLGLL
ncbi:putative sulfate exporter family transporter [Asaia sp. VD9]|uniref:YeiH family protein n=1 Tax=Asaia sp. VD9 TaxID=3081235 RepID=UPI0030173B8C